MNLSVSIPAFLDCKLVRIRLPIKLARSAWEIRIEKVPFIWLLGEYTVFLSKLLIALNIWKIWKEVLMTFSVKKRWFLLFELEI